VLGKAFGYPGIFQHAVHEVLPHIIEPLGSALLHVDHAFATGGAEQIRRQRWSNRLDVLDNLEKLGRPFVDQALPGCLGRALVSVLINALRLQIAYIHGPENKAQPSDLLHVLGSGFWRLSRYIFECVTIKQRTDRGHRSGVGSAFGPHAERFRQRIAEAEVADGHTSDVNTMIDAWQKTGG